MISVVDTHSNMKIVQIFYFNFTLFLFIRSSTLILVSPNPSLATKPALIPWSGLIYIHCDNGQKVRGLLES